MSLILDCTRSGERASLELEGHIDDEGAADLKRRAVHLISTGCNELVLNLERVSGIDAAGVQALSLIEAMVPGARKSLTLTAPPLEIRSRLEEAGLGDLVEGWSPFDFPAELFGVSLASSSA